MDQAHSISTPVEVKSGKNKLFEMYKDKEVSEKPYRQLVEALMYLAVATRPDIAYAATYLGQFNHCHIKEHWVAAKRVLRYLRGTINHGLCFRYSKSPVTGYTDAEWGGCSYDRRSYTGYVFLISGAAISWKSQKQRTVALSSTEAEYMALSEATKESIYLQSVLVELGLVELSDVKLFCDNRGAISLAENRVMHSRTEHIDIRYHLVRQGIREKKLRLNYLSTTNMTADVFTKALPKLKHAECTEDVGLRCII